MTGISKLSYFNQLAQRVAEFFEPAQSRATRRFNEARIASNQILQEQMKPNDGRRGFIFDSDKPKGIVVAVDKERLLEKMKTMKADHHINRQQVRACAKAFRANNDLHLMASFYVNEEGDICLLEGRHRLELLRQGSESMILINLFDHQESRVLDFSKQIDIVFETCGAEGASIVKNQPVVFCNVDFEESGHTPYIFEERVREPYYTVA